VADQVLATLYDFPVTLPADLVYFARTAALIEGLGTRYDPRFNAVTFAAPVALRLHREILASLADDDGRLPAGAADWGALAAAAGVAVGQVVTEVGTALREVGRGVLGLLGWVADEVDRAIGAPLARLAPPPAVASGGTEKGLDRITRITGFTG
jgi:hypothetical protein